MLLCYDICFHTPAIELAMGELAVTDFVFSTHWENEEGPPMALATAFFQSWSRGVGANLLAANEGMATLCDINWDRLSRLPPLYATLRTPCAVCILESRFTRG